MLRLMLSAAIALTCLLNTAQAQEEKSGAANSTRVCNSASGCSYQTNATAAAPLRPTARQFSRNTRRATTVATTRAPRVQQQAASKPEVTDSVEPAGGGGGSLVSEARRYLGLTGAQLGVKHAGAWCGEFLGRIARKIGVKTPGNPNWAPDWREAGQRISGPRPGAIALVNRGRGIGHVGIVTGVDGSGNPIIISGNHNNRVVETAYPRGSIAAYVWPES